MGGGTAIRSPEVSWMISQMFMWAEGIGCERRWFRWVLRVTATASGHPGVS